ncbi:hypothetical protein OJJOAM_003052 [Cupriavidus sp. H18C1]
MRRLIRSVSRKVGGADRAPADQDTAPDGQPTPTMPPMAPALAALAAGLDMMPNPVLLVAQPGMRIVYANPAAEDSFGLSRKSMLELSLSALFGRADELDAMIDSVLARQVDARRQDVVLQPRCASRCTRMW